MTDLHCIIENFHILFWDFYLFSPPRDLGIQIPLYSSLFGTWPVIKSLENVTIYGGQLGLGFIE